MASVHSLTAHRGHEAVNGPILTKHSVMNTVHCVVYTVCSVKCVIYTLHFNLNTLQCTQYPSGSALHTVHLKLYTYQRTVSNIP